MTTTNNIKNKYTPYQILITVILALTQFTVVLDFMIMSPLGDILKKSLSLSTSQFGAVVAAYAYSAGIMGLLTAAFADRFDRKKLLLIFYIGFVLGTLLCGMVNSFESLLAARIITGIFGGVISSISMAIVADLFALNQRGKVIGFIQMGFAVSQVLGIPISLYLANYLGWQAPFFMIVALGIIIWFVIFTWMKPITDHLKLQNQDSPLQHIWHTIKNKKYRVGFLATAFLSLGGWMMMPWGSIYAVNNLGLDQKTEIPMLFFIVGIATLIIMFLAGRLSDRMDRFKLFSIASVWMMVSVVIYTNLTPNPLWIVCLVNVLMMAGIFSRMIPSNVMVSALPDARDRGAFMSINASLQQLTGGIGATLSAVIVSQKNETSPLQNFSTLGFVVLGIIFLNIFFMYRVNNVIKIQEKDK